MWGTIHFWLLLSSRIPLPVSQPTDLTLSHHSFLTKLNIHSHLNSQTNAIIHPHIRTYTLAIDLLYHRCDPFVRPLTYSIPPQWTQLGWHYNTCCVLLTVLVSTHCNLGIIPHKSHRRPCIRHWTTQVVAHIIDLLSIERTFRNAAMTRVSAEIVSLKCIILCQICRILALKRTVWWGMKAFILT